MSRARRVAQSVAIRTNAQSKEQLILRTLKASSFADAINKYKLHNSENAWQDLENLATQEVQLRRAMSPLRNMMRTATRAVSNRGVNKHPQEGDLLHGHGDTWKVETVGPYGEVLTRNINTDNLRSFTAGELANMTVTSKMDFNRKNEKPNTPDT